MSDTTLAWRQYRLERKMFWRNPTAAFFSFVLPLIFLFLFGAVFSGESSGETKHELNAVVDVSGDSGRHRERFNGDGDTDVEVRDVDFDLARNVSRLGLDGERLERLINDAFTSLNKFRFTNKDERNFNGNGSVGVDSQEIYMQHVTTHRVTLKILDDGKVLLAIDIKGDESVKPSLGRERTTQIGPRHRDSDCIAA